MVYLETARGIMSEDGEIPTASLYMSAGSSNLLTVEQFLFSKPLTLQNFSTILPHASGTSNGSPSGMSSSAKSSLQWLHLVEMYSTCSLTNEQDKLAAIAGIAGICRPNTDLPYLAGSGQIASQRACYG
jgi:hypothetical protein